MYLAKRRCLERKKLLKTKNQPHAEQGSSICTAFNSHHLHLNSYRLSWHMTEFKMLEAAEGACSQISARCKRNISIYILMEAAGRRGNKVMNRGDVVTKI